jgi:hypothetical protein
MQVRFKIGHITDSIQFSVLSDELIKGLNGFIRIFKASVLVCASPSSSPTSLAKQIIQYQTIAKSSKIVI